MKRSSAGFRGTLGWTRPLGLGLATLLALPLGAAAQSALQLPEDQGAYPTGSLLIQNIDTVWTAAGDVLGNASILIEAGVIRAIGPDVTPPEGVTIVDGRGLYAIPGLVDEHTHTAMAASNEGTAPVVPEVRVIDALDPNAFGIYRALSGGITSGRVMHGSSNPIGGQSAVIKMRWGMASSRDLLVPGAPRFVKFALGENVTRKGRSIPGQTTRFPASRQGVEAVYVEAFTAAQAYRDAWARYRQDASTFRVPPRRDLRLEALVDIMEGRIRVHAHSYRSDEILMLMRVAERFGFRIDNFTHVLEGYRVASEMAQHGAGGSTFSDWWQYKLEAYEAIPYNAAIMHEHGVLTALNSDIPWLQSFMHLEFQKPVKYGGVSREEALRMITINPARMLGIDARVGSLEVGKDGDVVLLSRDPFDTYTRVEKTIVDGIVYYDLSEENETRGEPFNAIRVITAIEDQVAQTDQARGGPRAPATPAANPGLRNGEPLLEATDGAGQRSNRDDDSQEVQVTALVGATVHPVSGAPIEDGVVLMAAGRITAVGASSRVPVPEGAVQVDVSGKHVYPGLIDPISQLGIFEFGAVGQATDTNEAGDLNPHVRAISAVQPHGAGMKVARANGITSTLVSQTAGIVQGTAGFIQLKGDTWERTAVVPEAALVVDFPAPNEAPGSSGSWERFGRTHEEWAGGAVHSEGAVASRLPATQESASEEEPKLEGESMEKLVDLFTRARAHAAGAPLDEDPTAPFEPNVWGGGSVLLNAMAPVVRGNRPVLFRADTEWQLKTLFVFLDEFPEVDAVVVGGTQAYRVVEELARRDIGVIITSAYSPTPDRDESITASYRNAGILAAAGVRVAFGTNDSADSRNLPYHAAHSAAFGLPLDQALASVTLTAAELIGVDHLVGSLEAGKRADVIVTDGDPLQILTTVERMWIGGEEVDPRDNKHHTLYEEFRGRGL